MKIILAFLSIFIISVDQLIKFFVSETIGIQGIFIFPEILKLKIHQNAGIAFGLPFNPWLFYFLIIFLGIIILIISAIAKSKATKFARNDFQKVRNFFKENFLFLILIFSGALSNLLDRVRFGYVIDYIGLVPLKGTFNLADCVIVVGTGMIIWKILNKKS